MAAPACVMAAPACTAPAPSAGSASGGGGPSGGGDGAYGEGCPSAECGASNRSSCSLDRQPPSGRPEQAASDRSERTLSDRPSERLSEGRQSEGRENERLSERRSTDRGSAGASAAAVRGEYWSDRLLSEIAISRERSRPASRLSEASAITRHDDWRKRADGESSLALFCAFDMWLSVLWLYVIVIAIMSTPGIQTAWASDHSSIAPPPSDHSPIAPPPSLAPPPLLLESSLHLYDVHASVHAADALHHVPSSARPLALRVAAAAPPPPPFRSLGAVGVGLAHVLQLRDGLARGAGGGSMPPALPPPLPPLPADAPFAAVFGLLLCGASILVTIALLALFFLREWALVLFLWKLFELLCLALLLLAYSLTELSPHVHHANAAISVPLLSLLGSYALYTLFFLRQLWQVPRIREHYRRLPTRRDTGVAEAGVLQFGSFFFRRQDVLGAGGTARVYKGMYAGKLVAVKEIAATSMLPYGRAEAALLSSLRHPYVLAFFGCCVHERSLYIVTELCDMTLKELLARRERQRLALETAISLAMQVSEGLAYLHDSGVVHRDLSASNIFLTLEAPHGAASAKIGDFGLSRRTSQEHTSMTALIGTIQYMAPEMLTSSSGAGGRVEYSSAVDVYSLGIVLWQLTTCEVPYASSHARLNRFQLLQRIARDGLRPDVPPHAPRALASLMVDCWAEAEHSRPSSAEVVRRLRVLYYAEFGTEWRLSGSTGDGSPPEAGSGLPMLFSHRVRRRESSC